MPYLPANTFETRQALAAQHAAHKLRAERLAFACDAVSILLGAIMLALIVSGACVIEMRHVETMQISHTSHAKFALPNIR